ncbi:MAG: OsmC family protein [Calditrichia bacterium]
MPVRQASAVWTGNLPNGKGKMKTGSGALEGEYSFASRFENGKGTNPEELIGAAHAGCFSMALSNILDGAGFPPKRIFTTAKVNLVKSGDGFRISEITLDTEGEAEGIDERTFLKHAEEAKKNCPVSQALKGLEIKLHAKLLP